MKVKEVLAAVSTAETAANVKVILKAMMRFASWLEEMK